VHSLCSQLIINLIIVMSQGMYLQLFFSFFPHLMEEELNDLSYSWINSLIKCSSMLS